MQNKTKQAGMMMRPGDGALRPEVDLYFDMASHSDGTAADGMGPAPVSERELEAFTQVMHDCSVK
jgi:hypothetical protein